MSNNMVGSQTHEVSEKRSRFWFIGNDTFLILIWFFLLFILTGCRTPGDSTTATGEEIGQGQQTVIYASKTRARVKAKVPSDTASLGNSRTHSPWDDNKLTSPSVMVSGRVAFESGQPATSATVELYGLPPEEKHAFIMNRIGSTQADKRGRYELLVPDAKYLRLKVTGSVPEVIKTITGNLASDETTEPALRKVIQNVLVPDPQTLEGRVVGPNDEPLVGLQVYLRQYLKDYYLEKTLIPTHVSTTDTSGAFAFDNLSVGQWHLGVSAEGYMPIIEMIDLPTSEPVILKIANQGATVKGRVVLQATGEGVAGMEVEAGQPATAISELKNHKTISAVDGSFRFDNVSTGTLHILVRTNEKLGLGEVPPYQSYFSLEDQESTDVILYVYPGHSVSGIVHDKDTSEPLEGATLSVQDGRVFLGEKNRRQMVQSAEDGTFQISGIFANAGGVTVHVELDGYRIKEGAGSDGSISPKAPIENLEVYQDIPMERLVTVSGKVMTSDGLPVEGARVKFEGMKHGGHALKTAISKPDGSYSLSVISFDSGFVYVEANGYSPGRSDKVKLTTLPADDVNVKMELGATVRGKVLMPDGRIAVRARVLNKWPITFDEPGYAVTAQETVTDEQGNFVLQNLPQKPLLVASNAGAADSKPLALQLMPKEHRSNVTLQLQGSLSIAGKVVDGAGDPVQVDLTLYGPVDKSARTRSDGTFVCDGLANGNYAINAYRGGRHVGSLKDVKAGTDDVKLVIDDSPKMVTLLGTVVDDATNQPIEDFSVAAYKIDRLDEPGTFEVEIRRSVLASLTISNAEYGERKFQFPTGSDHETLRKTFRLGHGGIVTGRLLEQESRKPVAGATVMVWVDTPDWLRNHYPPAVHAVSDKDGKFMLVPVPGGNHEFAVRAPAPLAGHSQKIKVVSEETTDLENVLLSPAPTEGD